jgi:Nucleoside 2-deoxyribosyltransferase like
MSTPEVFLGGTCGSSAWRDELIPQLTINFFNPVVPDWNDAADALEKEKRATCDYVLYVLTPETPSTYSIAEVVQDSNIRPGRTVFCWLEEYGGVKLEGHQAKAFKNISKMVQLNGAQVFTSLAEVAEFLNR